MSPRTEYGAPRRLALVVSCSRLSNSFPAGVRGTNERELVKIRKNVRLWGLTAAAALISVVFVSSAAALTSATIYDATPNPLPPNVASLGFQATQTAEFGDEIVFGGTNRRVTSVTVTMSDWALHSTYPSMPAAGWTHPITLNLYNTNPTNPNLPGTLISTTTQSFLIPWRPEADPTCPGGTAWRASDGLCYNGLAFNITFTLNQVVPNSIVYGIAFNTNTWGYHPIGQPGPYESLNVGIPTGQVATTGLDVSSDQVFWNTMTPSNYTDGGAGGVGIFRRDTLWTPNGTVAAKFLATEIPVAPPTSKEQCKDGGWQSFNDPSFKNQGDCVSYVVSH